MESSTFNLKQILFAWILIFTLSFFIFIYIIFSNLFNKYVDQSSFKDLRHAKIIVENEIQKSKTNLNSNVARHLNSNSFIEAVENKDIFILNKYVQNWKATNAISSVSIYDADGLKLSLKNFSPITDNAKISSVVKEKLRKGYAFTRFLIKNKSLYVQVVRKINSVAGVSLGYIDELKEVDLKFIKNSMPGAESLILFGNGEAISLTKKVTSDYLKKLKNINTEAFEVSLSETNYDGLLYRFDGDIRFLIIKEKLKSAFYKIFYKQYLLYFIIYIFIISLFFYFSGMNMIIKPLERLSSYIKNSESGKSETIVTEIKNIQELVYARVGDYNKVIDETHSAREKEVNMMVATLAHELNNALSYVGGNVSFLKEETVEEQPDKSEIKDSLADIEKGFDRMKTIVSDLKVFSSNPEYQMKEIGLVEVFATVQKEFSGLEIKNEVSDIKVLVDPERLIQVLDNVVQNAIHSYIENPPSPAVIITAYSIQEEKSVYIDILDKGEGVSIENKKKIFQPFFTTKKNKGGTGLGLSLSRNIMKGMGGDLFLKDTSTKGSIFCIKVKQKS